MQKNKIIGIMVCTLFFMTHFSIIGLNNTVGMAKNWKLDKQLVMAETINFSIRLATTPSTLIFNQDFVPNGSLEYEWSILIDSDNDSSTGSDDWPLGYDVAIAFIHFKVEGILPLEDTIIGGTRKNTWVFNDSWWELRHEITMCHINYTTNTIHISGLRSWEELSNIEETDRFVIRTTYYSRDGENIDRTNSSEGKYFLTDIKGDVQQSFIDILAGSIGDLKPKSPAITGPAEGRADEAHIYTFVVESYSDLHYFIDWDDGSVEEWIGPFSSGEQVYRSHVWSEQGSYNIRAKVRDNYGVESDWSSLDVSMPISKPATNPILLRLMERYSEHFPILARL